MTGFGRRPFLAILASAFLPESALALAEKQPRYRVKVDEPVWIEVSAGIRLAGRLWLPDAPAGERFPVVLEYIPYRTFDRYRPLDDYWGAALAARGIAFARVDIRGSGNSEGLLLDEYLASEQQDGADVIAWLARQPWCNGAVGMRGLSWGGFSTLQIAAQRPPALKAIMPMCATDMRFRNDAHYVGGLPGLTNLKWAAGFELVMSSPPDPAVAGRDWEKMWRARLAATPSIAARWLRHDSNDDYWRHGSVGIAPDAIACPTYLVDGWADSYGQSAERLLRDLKAPHKALFGPWGHIYPQFAQPGPGLDWIEEEESWWKRWLNARPAGAVDGPAFRFYIAYATPAQSGMKSVPGRWAAEQHWPSLNIRERLLHLAPKRLAAAPAAGRLSYRAEKVVGLTAPEWIPYAATELPRDQTPDDARSLTFDLPIADNLELVGVPRARLRVASDRPLAAVAARLCEVDATGKSWLVSYGILNLCFRDRDTADPRHLEPGKFYDVDIDLAPIAYRFKPGCTLRLALSDSLWPLVWPSPEPVTLQFDLAGCRLALPVRSPPAVETAFPLPASDLQFPRDNPSLDIKEQSDGKVHIAGAWPASSSKVEATGTLLSGAGPDMTLDYDPADRASCRWLVTQNSRYRRVDWDCETRVSIAMTATTSHYRIEESLVALKDGKVIFERSHSDQIARRFS